MMDDTDTSHLQSPDATLPTSSLANDLKIPLTYSKGLSGAGQNNLEEKGVGSTEMYGHILKIHFCFFRHHLPQRPGTGFSLCSTRVVRIKVKGHVFDFRA